MGGLYKLFTKILPIMMLICFISFGILHTFQTEGEANLTYLTQETYNIGTEENPEYKSLYTFDTASYASNINTNFLKRSIEHTLTLEAYQKTLEKFQAIWADGYNLFDVSKTIANGVVLVINTLILPINILLIPIRIIAGIILTGMTIIGININNGTIICPMLIFILDKLAIPFITPEEEQPTTPPSDLYNTTWTIDTPTSWPNNKQSTRIEVLFSFTEAGGAEYIFDTIEISNLGGLWRITYSNREYPATYYPVTIWNENASWNWNEARNIKILENYNLTRQQQIEIKHSLFDYGSNRTPITNTTWQFHADNLDLMNSTADTYYYFYSFTNQSISYYGIKVEFDTIYYIDIDPNTQQYRYNIVYHNESWTNQDYRIINIVQQNMTVETIDRIQQILILNATQITV